MHPIRFSWAGESIIACSIGALVGNFVHAHRLGLVTDASGGYVLGRNPDTVVAPDLGFVRRERVPRDLDPYHFMPIPPDLAIEVTWSNATAHVAARCIGLYDEASVPLVWLVTVEDHAVAVHQAGQLVHRRSGWETLDGAAILPGFTIAVDAVFAGTPLA